MSTPTVPSERTARRDTRGEQLAYAYAAIEATLPARVPEFGPPEFRLDSCAYVCHGGPWTLSARMDHVHRAWVVSTAGPGWASGDHRCAGCLTLEEALAWGKTMFPKGSPRPLDPVRFESTPPAGPA